MKLFDIKVKFWSIIFFLIPSIYAQQNKDFELCTDQQTQPYYNPELRYKGGFWEIKNHFQTNYQENKYVNLENNSGIVTVQFVVNCEGKTGRFVTQSCDLNYSENQVNPLIVEHLLKLTMALNSWIVAKDEKKTKVNSHTFLSFRLVNGKITEILPK